MDVCYVLIKLDSLGPTKTISKDFDLYQFTVRQIIYKGRQFSATSYYPKEKSCSKPHSKETQNNIPGSQKEPQDNI